MNVETGNLMDLSEALKQKDFLKSYVRVDENEMTEKQRKTGKVSLNDHRSKLGKQLTGERKKRSGPTNLTPKKKKR